MKPHYLLDACALLAFFNGEAGANAVSGLLDRAMLGEITLSINAANLIEVYYDRIRVVGSGGADAIVRQIYDAFPLSIIETLNPEIVREAAHLKAPGKMSFADTILVATARCMGATIVSCDHAELGVLEIQEIPFLWLR
jgi:predicted nucleic acid-binding protein